MTKAWVWEAQALEVTVCLEVSRIDEAKPAGEPVITEDLGRANIFIRK